MLSTSSFVLHFSSLNDFFQGIEEDPIEDKSADSRYVSFCFERCYALRSSVDVVSSNHRMATLEPSLGIKVMDFRLLMRLRTPGVNRFICAFYDGAAR